MKANNSLSLSKQKPMRGKDVSIRQRLLSELSKEEILNEVAIILDDEKLMNEIGRMAQRENIPTWCALEWWEERRRIYGATERRWESAQSFLMFRSRMKKRKANTSKS